MFCWHKWIWKPEILDFGYSHYQKAVCQKCGKVKQRHIGWGAEVNKYRVPTLILKVKEK